MNKKLHPLIGLNRTLPAMAKIRQSVRYKDILEDLKNAIPEDVTGFISSTPEETPENLTSTSQDDSGLIFDNFVFPLDEPIDIINEPINVNTAPPMTLPGKVKPSNL